MQIQITKLTRSLIRALLKPSFCQKRYQRWTFQPFTALHWVERRQLRSQRLRKWAEKLKRLIGLKNFPLKLSEKREVTERVVVGIGFLPNGRTFLNFFDKDEWKNVPIYKAAGVPEAYKYVCDGLDALLKKHGYVRDGFVYRAETPNEDTIVLFCHFGLECVLLSHLLNISPVPLWHGTCAAPTSVTTLVTEERREGIAYFRMGSFGDTSHLYVEGVAPAFAARFCETYYRKDQRHD